MALRVGAADKVKAMREALLKFLSGVWQCQVRTSLANGESTGVVSGREGELGLVNVVVDTDGDVHINIECGSSFSIELE